MTEGSVVLVRLDPGEGPRLRALRLRALRDAPDAFGSTLEETAQRPDSSWRQQLEDLPTWFATALGEDVGMVRCEPSTESSDDVWLISLWVAPEARGVGVGQALVRAVADHAREDGATRVLLEVGDHNKPAIRLYEGAGFVATGGRRRHAPPRDHLVEVEYALPL